MSRYLLDTNVLSDLVNDRHGAVGTRIAGMSEIERRGLCTSIIVASEIRFEVLKKNSNRLARRVQEVLDSIEVLPLESGADQYYAALRLQLERSGTPISANDMLIAAHALAAQCILVTDNVGEFSRVTDLEIENWLRR